MTIFSMQKTYISLNDNFVLLRYVVAAGLSETAAALSPCRIAPT